MKTRYRDVTEKYKTFRLQPDSMYLSRLMQTFFNKFTKKGKKALARRHMFTALSRLRLTYNRPRTFNALIRIFRSLRTPFLLIGLRKGGTIESVPVPVRRNKRETLSLQTVYAAVGRRKEREFGERIEQELLALTVGRAQSATLRQRNQSFATMYEQRVNMEMR